jgi:hypothetical protein
MICSEILDPRHGRAQLQVKKSNGQVSVDRQGPRLMQPSGKSHQQHNSVYLRLFPETCQRSLGDRNAQFGGAVAVQDFGATDAEEKLYQKATETQEAERVTKITVEPKIE